MKPKRIKALKRYADSMGAVWGNGHVGDEPCYVLRQSDVRALAEQLVEDMYYYGASWEKSMLYALKRAGITPGRARKGTQ